MAMKKIKTNQIKEEIIKGSKRKYRIKGYNVIESRWDASKQKTVKQCHEEWYLEKKLSILGLFSIWWTVSSGRWFGICEYDCAERLWFDTEDDAVSMIEFLEHE